MSGGADSVRPGGTPADFHAALASPARRQLLDILRAGDRPRDVHELAESLGVHVTTVRFHLKMLTRAGLVRRIPGSSGQLGRPRSWYAAVTRGSAEAARDSYQELATALTAHLAGRDGDGAAMAEQAGQAWAGRLFTQPPPARVTVDEATRQISGLFAEMGFEPELIPDGQRHRIALHGCPFRQLARQHPDVVCSVHLGLLRGALGQLGVAAGSALAPFVEPELCMAEVIATSGAA